MTNNHPITPPPELVREWVDNWYGAKVKHDELVAFLATQAARWGADQELEATINYFHEYDASWGENSELITGLRTARRPKPPSLKEQALALLDPKLDGQPLTRAEADTIRRALNQLPNE